MKALIPILLLAVACSCPSKPATSTTPDPPPATQGSGSAAGSAGSAVEPSPNWPGSGSATGSAASAQTGPGIGENCGANDACAPGLTCVSYYGIAGARGPQFKSCEIRCERGGGCPDGLQCITIADGPGQVCRK
jgi:hypothetical protein